MIKEEIEYINLLGYHRTLTIIPQKNGLYSIKISCCGDVVFFDGDYTEEVVREFRKKILNCEKVLAIKNK